MGIRSSVSLYSLQMLHRTPATVRVLKEGGLSKGEHDVHLTVCTRTAYIPVPLEGNMTRKVVIN